MNVEHVVDSGSRIHFRIRSIRSIRGCSPTSHPRSSLLIRDIREIRGSSFGFCGSAVLWLLVLGQLREQPPATLPPLVEKLEFPVPSADRGRPRPLPTRSRTRQRLQNRWRCAGHCDGLPRTCLERSARCRPKRAAYAPAGSASWRKSSGKEACRRWASSSSSSSLAAPVRSGQNTRAHARTDPRPLAIRTTPATPASWPPRPVARTPPAPAAAAPAPPESSDLRHEESSQLFCRTVMRRQLSEAAE